MGYPVHSGLDLNTRRQEAKGQEIYQQSIRSQPYVESVKPRRCRRSETDLFTVHCVLDLAITSFVQLEYNGGCRPPFFLVSLQDSHGSLCLRCDFSNPAAPTCHIAEAPKYGGHLANPKKKRKNPVIASLGRIFPFNLALYSLEQ